MAYAIEQPQLMSHTVNGFPTKIIKRKDGVDGIKKFLCAKCRQLLKHPHQGMCGHRYCRDCLSLSENGSGRQLCPLCEEEGTVDDDSSYIDLQKAFPDNAIRKEMSSLDVICVMDSCPWEGKYKDLENHLAHCPHMLEPCTQCKESIPRGKMEEHVASKCGTLDLEAFKCPFGCSKVLTDQISLDDHENSELPNHLKSLLKKIVDIQSGIGEFKFDGGRRSKASAAPPDADLGIDQRIATMEAAIVVLSREVSCMYDKLNEFERNQNKAEEDLRKAQSLERKLLIQDAIINDLQSKLESLEKTSFDGVMIWRVEGFATHRENAHSGHITSIYSPPFFSSRAGYKMCARLYLNGDGMGKGTHVSIFFVLLRGPYDATLSWPFDLSVTFELMDLSGSGDGVKDTFKPDPGSSSFKKPTSNMNIASGCPLFVELSKFESMRSKFVKDDVLFVRIEVKSCDQSNSLFPLK